MRIIAARPTRDDTIMDIYLVHHSKPVHDNNFLSAWSDALAEVKKEFKKADPALPQWEKLDLIIKKLTEQGWQIIYPDVGTVIY